MSKPTKTADGPELGSDALSEDTCSFYYRFAARPVPVDPFYSRICYDCFPVSITAKSREEAERIAIFALGVPKERLTCKWDLKLLSVDPSTNDQGHRSCDDKSNPIES